jgi:hypothetical protein
MDLPAPKDEVLHPTVNKEPFLNRAERQFWKRLEIDVKKRLA